MLGAISSAQEYGNRIRKFRNALNLSQSDLAEKAGTTPQNISKYEREGIHDIEMIHTISQALGCDLLSDEIDAEGTVGEIGKEILIILIKGGTYHGVVTPGAIGMDELMDGGLLFGMSKERLTKEIFKLEKIGLCVREQYTDHYDEHNDRLFITSKGIITLKHLDAASRDSKELAKVKTYEMLCGEYSSYQEVLDTDVIQKLLRNIKYENGFRVNFIEYMKRKHENGLGIQPPTQEPGFFPGHNCFYDILYSMTLGITRKEADAWLQEIQIEKERSERIKELEKANLVNDPVLNDFEYQFGNDIKELEESTENPIFWEEQSIPEELGQLYDDNLSVRFSLYNTPRERYENAQKGHESENPLDWFSQAQIEQYVIDNVLPPVTEREQEIDAKIRKILELDESMLEYFQFPYVWEKNGLAKMIMDRYGYQN